MADSSDISARANDDEWVRAVIARALLADSEADAEGGADPVAPGLPQPNAGAWSATRLDTASITASTATAAESSERAQRIAQEGTANGLGASAVQPAAVQPAPVQPSVVPPPVAEPAVDSTFLTTFETFDAPATPTDPMGPPQPQVPVTARVDVPVEAQVPTAQVPTAEAPEQAPLQPEALTQPVQPLQPVQPAESLPPLQPFTPVGAPAPTIEAPTIEAPTIEAPTIEAPATEAPTMEALRPEPSARRQDQVIEPGRVEHGFSMTGQDGPLPSSSELVDEVMVTSEISTDGFRSSDLRTILEWLAVIGSALAVALLIKAFVLQAFWIPSESMETTVNRGDRILVNKVSYRLHEVRRGDLVVFSKIEGTAGTDDLIKRAIALPGETIEVRDDGRIWIWGPGEGPEDALLLDEPYLNPQNSILPAPSASDPVGQDIWDERCVNNRTPGRCTLDDSSFFMLGDNRVRSSDSRFFGPVPEENVVGRAFVRIWPLGDISTL